MVGKSGRVGSRLAPVVAKAAEVAAPIVISPGVVQAKLRLKLAASLRTGEQAAAYEAAKALAAQDPYAKAGLFETVEIKPYNWVFNNPEA